MKRNMKSIVLILVLALVSSVISGCGSSSATGGSTNGNNEAETYHFKLMHEETSEGEQQVFCDSLAGYLNEMSDGRITADIYTLGQLGDTDSQAELLQNGTVEMGIISNGSLGGIVEETNVFSLHYLMPEDSEKYSQLLNDPDSKGLEVINELLYDKGLKALNWFHMGHSCWTANKEIRTPADMKGMKFRVMSAPIITKAFAQYGPNPTPTNYTEIYSSMQLKMLDGQTNPRTCIKDMKFYEVQSHLIDAKAEYLTEMVTMNADVWESLPNDMQDIVMQAAARANEDYYTSFNANEALIDEFFISEGLEIVTLTPEERAVFSELAYPVRKAYTESSGSKASEVLKAFEEDVEKYK